MNRVVSLSATTCALLLCGVLLGGCPADGPGQLPPVPADIQACFRNGPVAIPSKALTAAEVEELWKDDRVQTVVMQRCGNRFLSWYDKLRAGWR
jgi:hypothetical protein